MPSRLAGATPTIRGAYTSGATASSGAVEQTIFAPASGESETAYYNQHRCHTGLAGLTPAQRSGAPSPPTARLDSYRWRRHCSGLFRLPPELEFATDTALCCMAGRVLFQA